MYSPYDGGYSTDNRRVTSEVNQNINNINERTEEMQSDFRGLEQAMKEWVSSNRNSVESINSNNYILESQVSTNFSDFQSVHVQSLKPLMDSMDDILDNIDTSSSLSQRLRNSGIESSTLSLLPSHMANPNNDILNSYGYTQRHYPANQNQTALKLEFLKKKKDNYQEIIQNRVKKNHSNNRLDTIIGNQEEWNNYLERSKAYWRYASAFSTINNNETNWDYIQIKNLKNFYLKKSEELMYSAIGAIEQEEPSEFNLISKKSADYVREQLRDTLSDYFDGNLPDPPKGLENTACNIFVANALLEVYGVPDLVNLQNNAGDFYQANWLANDIIKELDKSKNWSTLGVATSQADIDNAAYYASIGFPVVAVRPSNVRGHIALISPGYPDFKSPTWANRANHPDYSDISYSEYMNLRLPKMINYSLNKPQYSGFNIEFSQVYSNPAGVIFYIRKP